LPRKRLRRPLRLQPRGLFQFTPKTVSIDVSAVAPGPGSRKILHVSRSRGALETFDPDEPAREVDLARVVALLELEDSRRQAAGEPGIETLFEPRHLQDVRRLAKSLLRASPGALPFEGRPRTCFESNGTHLGEFLWIARDLPEAVIETRFPSFDAAGFTSTFRRISREAAAAWLARESRGLEGDLLGLSETVDDEPHDATEDRPETRRQH